MEFPRLGRTHATLDEGTIKPVMSSIYIPGGACCGMGTRSYIALSCAPSICISASSSSDLGGSFSDMTRDVD